MFVFGAVVTVVVLHVAAADVGVVFAVVFQSAAVVVGVAAAVVPCVVAAAAAAAELAVAVSAVEMFEIGVLVVHDVAAAAVAAEPQVLPTAFARAHCFVGD